MISRRDVLRVNFAPRRAPVFRDFFSFSGKFPRIDVAIVLGLVLLIVLDVIAQSVRIEVGSIKVARMHKDIVAMQPDVNAVLAEAADASQLASIVGALGSARSDGPNMVRSIETVLGRFPRGAYVSTLNVDESGRVSATGFADSMRTADAAFSAFQDPDASYSTHAVGKHLDYSVGTGMQASPEHGSPASPQGAQP